MAAEVMLRCPRCGEISPTDWPSYRGCPTCRDNDVVPVNLVGAYEIDPVAARAVLEPGSGGRGGLWRYAPLLPVTAERAPDLGEGGTPLLHLERLGASWGLNRLFAKNESVNPTWSHKDRLCSVATAAALAAGATVTTAASTGNHGASVAAYAARAGLSCVIFTLESVPVTMKILMQSYGAVVVAGRDMDRRNALMNAAVEQFGWYPISNAVTPPIGSSPYGVDGYKTLAYEIWEQLGRTVPDWVVIPVAYGDCLAGVLRGFADLCRLGLAHRVPRLVGAEVFDALALALQSDQLSADPVRTWQTHAFSIGGPFTTYQALNAIRESKGVARSASEEQMMDAQSDLGAAEGLFVEAASAMGAAVVKRLAAEGVIGGDDVVVVVLTSSGLKDPAATAAGLAPVPVLDVDLAALRQSINQSLIVSQRTASREAIFAD